MNKNALYSRNISESKKLICTTITRVEHLNISIWHGNRQLDLKRIAEIEQSYIDNKYTSIPGIISVVRIDDIDASVKYQIYDGMHRFMATKSFLIIESDAIIYYL